MQYFSLQQALVLSLLAISSDATPLTSTSQPNAFSVKQVSRPGIQRENRALHAINRAHRRFGHGNAPAAPPMAMVQKPLRKAGTKSKLAKDGRKGSETASSDPKNPDLEYVCEVEVGGQPVRLNFDTGSSDLWMYSTEQKPGDLKEHKFYDPKKSKSAKKMDGGSWTISYGDGSSASGVVYTDSVNVGGNIADVQAIELAKNVSNSFLQDNFNDGLLGLGFPKGKSKGAGNTISVNGASQPQNTYFSNIRPKLPLPLFTADLKHTAPGSYDFGFIDRAKYTGDIKYFDADSADAYWAITSNSYGIAGKMTNKNIKTIIDTGTTLMLMPQDVLTTYYSQVKGAKNDQQMGGYIFPCSAKIPDFQIGFGTKPNDFTATIAAKYMNFGPAVTSDPSVCFGAMQVMPAGDSLQAIYGDIFLKAVFTVFEAKTDDKPRLGFALKPDSLTPSSSTPAPTSTSTPSSTPTSSCTPSTDSDKKKKGMSIFQNLANWGLNKVFGIQLKDECSLGSGSSGSDSIYGSNGSDSSSNSSGSDFDGSDGSDGSSSDGADGDDDDEEEKKSKKGKGKSKSKSSKKGKKVSSDEDDDEDSKPKKNKKVSSKSKDSDDDDDEDVKPKKSKAKSKAKSKSKSKSQKKAKKPTSEDDDDDKDFE